MKKVFSANAVVEIKKLMALANEEGPQIFYPQEEDIIGETVMPRDMEGELSPLLVYHNSVSLGVVSLIL